EARVLVVIGLAERGRRRGDDLEPRGNAETGQGTWQAVVAERERTAVVLVADEPAVVAEDVAPEEVGAGERPVVVTPHRVAGDAAADAEPEAVIAAEEEREPGEGCLRPGDGRAGPQAGGQVSPHG